MKTKRKIVTMIATAITLTMFVVACKKSASTGPNPYPTNTTPPAVTGVQLKANATFGNILADNNGNSLYFFAQDAGTASTCVDGCVLVWPVFYKENPSIGTGLDASDFGVITRPDGTKQNTYKGWPLYYYSGDQKAGDTKGDKFANVWAIARPDYSVMFASAQLVGLDNANYNDQSLAGTGASQFITDAKGQTLYWFTRDSLNKNKFTKADFSNNGVWPIDTVTNLGSFPSIFDKTQFTTIDVFGKKQLTYKGHPLYYFGQDGAKRGSTKGVSFPTPGAAIWRVGNTGTTVNY